LDSLQTNKTTTKQQQQNPEELLCKNIIKIIENGDNRKILDNQNPESHYYGLHFSGLQYFGFILNIVIGLIHVS
jgi:hypothetical protein